MFTRERGSDEQPPGGCGPVIIGYALVLVIAAVIIIYVAIIRPGLK